MKVHYDSRDLDQLDQDLETNLIEILHELNELDATDLKSLSFSQATQVQLEQLYSKYQLVSCLTESLIEEGAVESFEELGIPPKFGLSLMVQMMLHKRATVSTMVGILMKHFENHENPPQACADMLDRCVEAGVVDLEEILSHDDSVGGKPKKEHRLVVVYDIGEELQERIDKFQYPLPMIEEPSLVTNNRQTGYRTIRGSMILKNNHHDMDICLDHINRVNAIPLAVNADIVAFIQNHWRNIDKQKPGENRNKFLARKKAFEKYNRASRDVLQALLAQGNRFWLTHKYDKRGRVYSQGYHANYQGNDWNKAVIEFSEKEPLNPE